MNRSRGIRIVALVATGVMCALGLSSAAAMGAPARIAPPANAAVTSACGVRQAAQQRTADVERAVSGVQQLGGCVADMSGIAHLIIDWESAEDTRHGRICADPVVRRDSWSCAWDTATLTPGAYRVRMTAIDAAGNRGVVTQAYRVDAPRSHTAPSPPTAKKDSGPAPSPAPSPSPMPSPDPVPGPSTSQPAPPAIVDPAATDPSLAPTADASPSPSASGTGTPAETAPSTSPELAEPALQPLSPLPEPSQQVVSTTLQECAQLELAPGAPADRALSLAVLDCMQPAIRAVGATTSTLDDIPVPPALHLTFPDEQSRANADALLPDSVGAVRVDLVVDPDASSAAAAVS